MFTQGRSTMQAHKILLNRVAIVIYNSYNFLNLVILFTDKNVLDNSY